MELARGLLSLRVLRNGELLCKHASFFVDALSESQLCPLLTDVFKLTKEAKVLPIPRISVESVQENDRPAGKPADEDHGESELVDTHGRTPFAVEARMKPKRAELEAAVRIAKLEAQVEALEYVLLGVLVGARENESMQRGVAAASMLMTELTNAPDGLSTAIHRQRVRDYFADIAYAVWLEDPPPDSPRH